MAFGDFPSLAGLNLAGLESGAGVPTGAFGLPKPPGFLQRFNGAFDNVLGQIGGINPAVPEQYRQQLALQQIAALGNSIAAGQGVPAAVGAFFDAGQRGAIGAYQAQALEDARERVRRREGIATQLETQLGPKMGPLAAEVFRSNPGALIPLLAQQGPKPQGPLSPQGKLGADLAALQAAGVGSDDPVAQAILYELNKRDPVGGVGAGERDLKPSDIGGIRKEFTGLSKDFVKIRDAYDRVQSAARSPSAAGDLALIFNYMKILDPGSVVREGEFATAQNAAGVPEQLRAQYNKVISGERLTDATRDDFVSQARGLFQSQAQNQLELESQFGGIAERTGAAREDVVVDFLGNQREEAQIISQGGEYVGKVKGGGSVYRMPDGRQLVVE